MNQDRRLRVACLQMNSSADVQQNLATVAETLASSPPCDLLVLPENFAQMPSHRAQQHIEHANDSSAPVQSFLLNLAEAYGLLIVAGSLPVIETATTKPFSRCLLVSPQGVVGHYDKLHLFDVDVSHDNTGDENSGNQINHRYRESDSYQAGRIDAQQHTPHLLQFDAITVRLGASICYDLRFPELYRSFAEQGVDLITVPAAFTYETGSVHWQVLLRARAIENQSFVIAAAQVGTHANGRKTWGHSMVVGPWGEVIAQLENEPGLLYAELDLHQSDALKQRFPVLHHRRL